MMYHCKKKYFYSHGKLLLTGEYLILCGALGLALPTIRGQSLNIIEDNKKNTSSILHWRSYDNFNKLWFEGVFQLPFFKIFHETEKKTAIRLRNLLIKSKIIQKKFLSQSFNIYVNTYLQFSRDWGLGSSSTLINNIAKWAQINPYYLLGNDFPGSGYDIACVSTSKPIIYRIVKKNPCFIPIKFNPPFKDKLFFLHLNKKKNTINGIRFFYSKKNILNNKIIDSISSITLEILCCKTLKKFEELLLKHEMIISKILNLPTIKELYFPDYLGMVKSLGTWGGDFVLISFRKGMKKYFSKKGFNTLIAFDKMIF
ncbi:GYDIA family GHMP kinase [Blattabacterium cuenoti]|uniref:GYDIA family GHMP kinase n=1 Tax=Blattabacterium cuenoti TaxID=1653831 RepID=UPI00163C205F|nr:GYDIA family GHMP kinase [Blattabacterium cuenoti]